MDKSTFSAYMFKKQQEPAHLERSWRPCFLEPPGAVGSGADWGSVVGSQSAVPYSGLGNGIHPVRTVGAWHRGNHKEIDPQA